METTANYEVQPAIAAIEDDEEFKTAKQFYEDFGLQDWQEIDRLRLASMLILDLIEQPTRIAICCQVIDKAFATGK